MAVPASAADEAADVLIKRLSTEVLDNIKADKAIQSGDLSRIIALVDVKIMPNVNFHRMTAMAVGPTWRQATPEQQKLLQDEFKIVVVRTEVKGRGDAIQLDYRLEKTPGEGAGWKIFNMNVLGVWLVETYRSQFAQEISAKGINGLIATLAERNKTNAKKG